MQRPHLFIINPWGLISCRGVKGSCRWKIFWVIRYFGWNFIWVGDALFWRSLIIFLFFVSICFLVGRFFPLLHNEFFLNKRKRNKTKRGIVIRGGPHWDLTMHVVGGRPTCINLGWSPPSNLGPLSKHTWKSELPSKSHKKFMGLPLIPTWKSWVCPKTQLPVWIRPPRTKNLGPLALSPWWSWERESGNYIRSSQIT